MHIQLKERVLKVILLLLIKMDASFRISGTVMIRVNISILWDNLHGEEYLIEEINENLPSYLQIKVWVFPNHSIFGKSHTPPRKYVVWRGGTWCVFSKFLVNVVWGLRNLLIFRYVLEKWDDYFFGGIFS